MGSYAGDQSSYFPSITIFETDTLVLGGIDGPDNIALKQLADSGSYIKKFKGRIVRGTGVPNASTLSGFNADANVVTNTLYLDEATQSFWKPNDSIGSTWTNFTKAAKLNIKGLKLNDAGDDTDFLKLEYDAANNRLMVKKPDNTLGNIRVAKVIFNQIDGEALDTAKIVDSEIILLFDIASEAQNQNAQYAVKRLSDIPALVVTAWDNTNPDSKFTFNTAPAPYLAVNDYVQIRELPEDTGDNINGYYLVKTIGGNFIEVDQNYKKIVANATAETGLSGSISKDNSAMIMWNETAGYWELRDRAGNLLSINVGGLYINGVLSEIIPDRVVRNNLDYMEIFAHVETGQDTCYLKKPETGYTEYIKNEWIIIRPNEDSADGSYDVLNNIEIPKSNLKLEFYPGATFKFLGNYTVRVRNDSDAPVYKYDGSSVRIYSENTYRTEGEFAGNQVAPLAGDEFFTFSDSPAVNRERSIVSIKKIAEENLFLRPDTRNALDTALSSGAQSVLASQTSTVRYTRFGIDYMGVAYINNSQIYFSILQFNGTTKNYEQVYPTVPTPIYTSSISPSRTFSKVWATQNGSRFVVFGYDSAANVVRCVFSNNMSTTPIWTSQFSSFQILDGSGASLTNYDRFKFIVDSDGPNTFYGFLRKSNGDFLVTKGTMNFSFGLYTPVTNGYTTSVPAITGVETDDFDILDYDGTNILLSYCKQSTGVDKLFLARITKSSGTIGSQPATHSSPAGANLYGEVSKLLKAKNGSLYCFFTETVSPNVRNNVLYSKLDFSISATWLASGYTNLQIAGVSDDDATYDFIDVVYNDKNIYPVAQHPFYELVLTNSGNTHTENSTTYLYKTVEQFNKGNDRLKISAHVLRPNDIVYLTTTGLLPTGLSLDTDYYVSVYDANNIQLKATVGGPIVNFTTNGSGVAKVNLRASNISAFDSVNDRVDFSPGHPTLQIGDKLRFRTDGTFPTTTPQINDQTFFYITAAVSGSEIQISDTYGGAAVDIGSGGSGNWWIEREAISGSETPPNPSTDTFFHAAHGYHDGDQVYFQTTGAGVLPTGVESNRLYYVVNSSTPSFKISKTIGGSPVDFTDTGTAPYLVYRLKANVFDYTQTISKICTYFDPDGISQPTLDSVSKWSVATISVSFPYLLRSIKTQIAQYHRDYLFVHYIDQTDGFKNYFAKIYLALDILPNLPIEVQDLDDVVFSDNVVHNLDIMMFFKGMGSGTGSSFITTVLRAGNTVKSRIAARIERTDGVTGMDFQAKTQGLDVNLSIDETNEFVSGVKKLNHSFGFIDIENTGTKAFDTCRNVALQGFVDGDASILSAGLLDS